MMTPERSELLNALAELSERYPQWRLGQLVSNGAGWSDVDIWDVEDDLLLSAVRSHLERLANRDQNVEVSRVS